MRDSFVLYRSVYDAAKGLPPEMFKEWVLAVMEYGLDHKEPETVIGAAGVGAIRSQMDKDHEAYSRTVERNRENGAKGGRPKKPTETQENPLGFSENPEKPTGTQRNPEKPDNDNDNDYVKEKPPIGGKKKSDRFSAPTVENVKGYCTEKGLAVDAERFVDFYASKGWRVGNAPMKDWRAACRNWARQDKEKARPRKNAFLNFEQRTNDLDAEMLERIRRQDKAEETGRDLDAEMFARIRARREAAG